MDDRPIAECHTCANITATGPRPEQVTIHDGPRLVSGIREEVCRRNNHDVRPVAGKGD